VIGIVVVTHSARLANGVLQTFDPGWAKRVLLSNAPVVEGAVVAAVEGTIGKSLEEVEVSAVAAL
jgi:dihydroxyacetone kinase DhaKLM complex PTS-EIIA-like component DhaM